jgi:hypothetical protein
MGLVDILVAVLLICAYAAGVLSGRYFWLRAAAIYVLLGALSVSMFCLVLVGPRLALAQYEAGGGQWSKELVAGIVAYRDAASPYHAVIFLSGLLLALLALRPAEKKAGAAQQGIQPDGPASGGPAG